MEQDFLGCGMKFPPQVNPATGRFMTAKGRDSIRESIYLILMTQKTERFVRPEFGSSLMSYTFMDTGVTILNMLIREVTGDILQQEPRVSDVSVRAEPDSQGGRLLINIEYVVRETNIRDNLVFPFYLNSDWAEGDEGEDREG